MLFRSTFTMNGGTITGNVASYNGGGVFVNWDSEFTLNGGRVKGNVASHSTATSYGGGVFAYGKFNMNGGAIVGNSADIGGGVYLSGSNSFFNLSGNSTICDNYVVVEGAEVASNLCLPRNKTINVTGALADADQHAWIGVTLASEEVFTTDYGAHNQGKDPSDYFFGDNGCNVALNDDGEVYLTDEETHVHVMGDWSSRSDDEHYRKCNNCDYEETHYMQKSNQEELKVATCYSEGAKYYTCTVCGLQLVTETIAKTDHTSDGGVVTQEATCDKAGLTVYTCSVCGEVLSRQIIEPIGHVWNNGVITQKQAPLKQGVRTFTCVTCDGTKTETIPAQFPWLLTVLLVVLIAGTAVLIWQLVRRRRKATTNENVQVDEGGNE